MIYMKTNFKVGLILGYLHRAFCVCSSWALFHLEVMNITHIFINNGYPINFVQNVISKFVYSKFIVRTVPVKQSYTNSLTIPFVGHCSVILKKQLLHLFKSHNCTVNIVFSTSKVSQYISLKDRTPHSLKSGVVYRYSCQNDSGIAYIGKTKRHLFKRVAEHRSHLSSIRDHLLSCNHYCTDSFSCKSFSILYSNHSDFSLQIIEALCIKKFNPSLNTQLANRGYSYFLKLF